MIDMIIGKLGRQLCCCCHLQYPVRFQVAVLHVGFLMFSYTYRCCFGSFHEFKTYILADVTS